MIKFFRRIRQRLLKEGRISNYLAYAIGEILLVVIGILIALQINTWNQERLSNKREIEYLRNLQEETRVNIKNMKTLDSLYSSFEDQCKIGLNMMKDELNISDFLKIDSLFTTRWKTFPVSRSSYDEMLNNGSFYSLKNQKLREQINDLYIEADNCVSAFSELNDNGQAIKYNPHIFPVDVLRDRLRQPNADLSKLDTTWIHNPSSKEYAGYYRMGRFFKRSNSVRGYLAREFMDSCKELHKDLDKELTSRQ